MITTSQMYWITRLDGIVTLLAILASFLCVASVIMFVSERCDCHAVKQWSWDTNESIAARRKFGSRMCKASLMMSPVGILLYILFVMIPTEKQMAAILIVPRIANSEKVRQAGNKLYDLAVEWMDELKPNKNNNKKETAK